MNIKKIKSLLQTFPIIILAVVFNSCLDTAKESDTKDEKTTDAKTVIYPNDVIPFLEKWKIMLGKEEIII